MKILGIIPARAGSKRLKNKNLLELAGKPLINWTIEAALTSNILSKVVVSTDCPQIMSVSKHAGADVPFLRPTELSTDKSSPVEVVFHALDFYDKNKNLQFDYIMLLQPTSPFRNKNHVKKAFEMMQKSKSTSCVSVTLSACNPNWMFWLNFKGKGMSPILEEFKAERSQDSRSAYSLNGAIYICKTEQFKKHRKFIFASTKPFIMDKEDSIDIDTIEDFNRAKKIIENK